MGSCFVLLIDYSPGSEAPCQRDHAIASVQHEPSVEEACLVTTEANAKQRPGIRVGSAYEFSSFFRVKPGRGAADRGAVRPLVDTSGCRPGDFGRPSSSIHEPHGCRMYRDHPCGFGIDKMPPSP